MRFSIIIPVYNVEKYIRRCMESVMHQSFEDYEVIVVDDESPDHSMDIVREFAREQPDKIRMIHQKNTRQGGARNHGVQYARGEYLIFVDSDDYVHTDMLKIVDERLREMACDILVFGHQTVTEAGEPVSELCFDGLSPGIYVPAEDKRVIMQSCAPWKKAFRREFYQESGFRFPEKLLYEDTTTRFLFAKAQSIRICEDRLYYYVQSSNSSMRQKLTEKMLDILPVADMVREQFAHAGLYETFREPLEICLIYSIVHILEIINASDPQNPMQIPLADYIAVHFPDYASNPYGSDELKRSLDCLIAHHFGRYHYRFLLLNRAKEKLLALPAVAKLNDLRKKQ